MFEGLLQPMHLLLILIIALVVFGPKKLPEIGKGLGEAIRGFKKALDESASEPVKPVQISKNEEEKKVNS
jgi:sec-independent protein translocase protein TatA